MVIWENNINTQDHGLEILRKSLQIHNLHLMKSQRPSGGFCYKSFMVFGALDHFEKTGHTNTLLKVAKS